MYVYEELSVNCYCNATKGDDDEVPATWVDGRPYEVTAIPAPVVAMIATTLALAVTAGLVIAADEWSDVALALAIASTWTTIFLAAALTQFGRQDG